MALSGEALKTGFIKYLDIGTSDNPDSRVRVSAGARIRGIFEYSNTNPQTGENQDTRSVLLDGMVTSMNNEGVTLRSLINSQKPTLPLEALVRLQYGHLKLEVTPKEAAQRQSRSNRPLDILLSY